MNAAGGQLFHVLWIEDQLQRSKRSVLTQDLGHFADIHPDTRGAPHVVDGIGVARIVLRRAILDDIPKVFRIWQLFHVELLKRPGGNLTLKERSRRHHDVIARTACQHLGFQNLIAVKDVVDQLDPGFFLEFREQLFVDVVGPVVNTHFLGNGCAGQQR